MDHETDLRLGRSGRLEALAGWHFGVTSRLVLSSAAIVILAAGCAYPYYSYPYWYYPPGHSSAPVVEQPPMTERPSLVQREVVYPHGKYVLSGDGVSEPWHWTWVPLALPPPSSPPVSR